MLLQIFDTWSLRLHVESNKTPRFLGGSLLGVMRESPMFMPICWFWLVLLWVVITISSVLSSFSFKRLLAGLGSIPFFQFNSNSNSVIFNSNSNSNSTTHNKFQFQFQFQTFQFQFQFQFRRIKIQSQFLTWPFDVFLEIYYDFNNKVHVYKIIVINTISLISLVKWL